ncbi:MAG TPA: single-stranded-DNA-specific exonuclease RecJ [Acetivibrio sp.]|nr:single-stranded-DNA-specific exonuclease RecJ [Clostridium sp.]HOQ36737.1 single-stranded-DNA-specific exonuclease RecJ [Acetivibrio sp.]HPT91687.1 single-stranded-DNA-specific exonuclease RecJ [Acetivibrio sp.]HQA57669.1 single-stranded-DNA-specific exonuclease RecJ [Acetivibrio sp.]
MDIKVNILSEKSIVPKEVLDACGGDELIARIFYNRGYKDPETIAQMLNEQFYKPTGTNEFPNITKAVERISMAIDRGEKICVYGDYDVDGVTSTVTFVECLKYFTSSVIYHVPDRFTEGYGMNEDVVKELSRQGVSLIITCDCGISNMNEITLAKQLGMDVILTDHHTIPDELPPADVILNPKLLGEGHRARNISGCGMAYFLCLALLESKGLKDRASDFLDLLALSLIADVVSLNGENRYLLKKALPVLFNTKRIGLKKLLDLAEKNGKLESEEDIAFQIAPRINAAGRMETARLPVELLLCKDPDRAQEMAEKIDLLNMERKRVQQSIVDEAVEMVETRKKNKTILVLFSEHWHHGIIGIAAGRICELYRKPAILLSMKEDGTTVVGSARSIEEIDIYELIKGCSGRLLKFGGHSQAAGLSIKREDLSDFTAEIETAAENRYYIKDQIIVDVDMELEIEKVNDELFKRIESAGPYGEGFEAPLFYTRGIRVVSDRKTEKNHHIMVLEDQSQNRVKAVKWFGADKSLEGKCFDVTYKICRNNYGKDQSIQLNLGYMIEASGEPKILFAGSITDERRVRAESILKKYPQAQLFYEGLKSACNLDNTVDRYSVKECRDLVFLSTPANTSVFREVIALANPENIIINFSILPDYTFKGFVLNLLGLLKHIIKKRGGRALVEEISLKLCVEDNIVKSGLKYLMQSGMINYVLSEDEQSFFAFEGKGNSGNKVFAAKKNLMNALMEKKAYQDFILSMEADKFMEYLK